MLFEVCIDSVEGSLAAQSAGAQRVELCAGLVEGGVTPSLGMVRQARRAAPNITLHVLIRPRGGDFLASDAEFAVMQDDIRAAKDAGADGVVLGLLTPGGRVDLDRTAALVALAHPLSVTFHRAFDLARDPDEALADLINLGASRVLTSGQQPTALAGADCIARLVRLAGSRIAILAGGGVTRETLPALAAATGVTEVHFSARETAESPMAFRRDGVYMGKAYTPDEYARRVTSAEMIRRVISSLDPSA